MGKAEKVEKTNKKQKHFWKDFKAELKKVIWPTRSQVVNNTIIVIAIVVIVTAVVFVLDLAFEALNTYGIDKLKTVVRNSVTNSQEQNTENNDENSTNTENSTENNDEVKEGNGEENNASGDGAEADDTANIENALNN